MDIQQTLTIVESRIRVKFQGWCAALGWSRETINDWAEEIAAEGVSLVYRQVEEEFTDTSRFHAYCVNKAKGLARDELRKETFRRRAEATLVHEKSLREYQGDPIWFLLERITLKELLHHLSEPQREVLALYCVAHLKMDEISRMQRVPVKTLYTVLRRARLKLAALTEEQDGQAPAATGELEASPHPSRPVTRPPPVKAATLRHSQPT